jgi:DNA-3-methyladenine glycosylase I
LEGVQAGLSWETVLRKRGSYRAAFDHFDAPAITSYKQSKVRELLANQSIIRNRLKIEAAIQNARSLLAVQKEFGSFNEYVWRFVGGRPKQDN